MKKETRVKFLSGLAALAVLASSLFVSAISVSADTAGDVRAAASAYVEAKRNDVTPEGLLAAVKAVAPTATMSYDRTNYVPEDGKYQITGDFFIKHAIPGVKDDDTTSGYPLSIPGSDGAVAAVFDVDGEKIGFSAAFAHEKEVIHITETAIVGTSEGFTYDASGNVTNYTGNADKIVFPPTCKGSMAGGTATQTSPGLNAVKVVMIRDDQQEAHNALTKFSFAGWQNLRALDISGDKGYYWSGQYSPFVFNENATVYECKNLKYVKMPTSLNGETIGFNQFNGCTALENINIPLRAAFLEGSFIQTAIRDFFIGGDAGGWAVSTLAPESDNGSAAASNPAFTDGTRNLIVSTAETKMDFFRAVALASAKVNELAYTAGMTDADVVAAAKAAIDGTSDAAAYRDTLTYNWNDTWTGTGDVIGGVLTISDGTNAIPIDFSRDVGHGLAALDAGYTLTPAFAPSTLQYAVTVPNGVTSLNLSAQPLPGAALGTTTGNSDFKIGENTVTIATTSANGSPVTYTLTVTRLPNYGLADMTNMLREAAAKSACTNATTKEGLEADLTAAIKRYTEETMTLSLTDFYAYKAVGGAKEEGTVLVPGHNGYIGAVAKLTVGEQSATVPLLCTIQAPMKNYSFAEAEVSKASDFTLSSNGKSVISYKGAAKKIVIPEGVEEIEFDWNMSEYPENALALILPDSVKTLPPKMCERMCNLEVVTMGDGVTELPESIFDFCYFLQYVRLSETIEVIPAYAFRSTGALSALHIPASVTEINGFAFEGSLIRDLKLPAGVATIGGSAFAYPLNSALLYTSSAAQGGRGGDYPLTNEDAVRLQLLMEAAVPDRAAPRVLTFLNPDAEMPNLSALECTGTNWHDGPITVRATANSLIGEALADTTKTGVTFEELDMTLAEAAARAQYAADHLYLVNASTAEGVAAAIQSSYSSSKIGTPVWKDAFTLTPATDAAPGSAAGSLRVADDSVAFEITLDRSVYVGQPAKPGEPSEPSVPSESGEPTEPGKPGIPSDPDESDDPANPGTGEKTMAAAAGLLVAAGLAAGVLSMKRRKSSI